MLTSLLTSDNTLIKIWVNVENKEALQKAESLLRDMSRPDSISYSTLIHGWSKLRFPGAGSRARDLFDELLQLPPSLQRRDFSITTVCNSVMSSIARSGEPDAPKRVGALLSQLEGRFLNGDNSAQPDKTSFLCVFDAYAKAGIPDADERCDALLSRMDHYREVFRLDDLQPDRSVYNAYLNALAKSQQQSAVDKAEEVLTMMETSRNPDLRPDIVTYTTFIDCHTKCGERSLERADELLRFVEGTYRRGDATLMPNAVFYSAILQAWAKTGTAKGAMKAEELLQRNLALYEEGNDYAKPHIIVYNAVMDALARSGVENAGPRAEELMVEAESRYQAGDEEMRPTCRSFNAVILAHRADGDAGEKAEALLDRMEEMADAGRYEVRPDVVTYNNVIGAVVEDSSIADNAADKAQSLLDRMEERGVSPDGRTYGLVIETWLRRKDEKGNALADAMLNQFQDMLEEKKAKREARQKCLYENAVWDVINAYRGPSKNDTLAAFLE
jgi:PPR repeat family